MLEDIQLHPQEPRQEETFGSLCVHKKTNDWLAHVQIFTRCGTLLDLCRTMDKYSVRDGDTLTVILVPDEATSPDEAAGDMEEID